MITPDHKDFDDNATNEQSPKEKTSVEEVQDLKENLRYVEKFITETRRANDFNEEHINRLINDIAWIKRTITTLIEDLELIKQAIATNQTSIPTTTKEILPLHSKSLLATTTDANDPKNSLDKSSVLESESKSNANKIIPKATV